MKATASSVRRSSTCSRSKKWGGAAVNRIVADMDFGLLLEVAHQTRRTRRRCHAHHQYRDRLAPDGGAGRGQTQLAMAHFGPRHAPGARRARGAARFAPLAHAVDLDLDVPVGGAGAQGLKQLRGALGETAVMLGAHEHLDPVQAALLVEQLEEIGLPIHDADHPRLAAHRRRRLLDIAQTVGPTPHLAGLVWRQRRGGFRVLRRLPATRRRIETATQHPQRQPLAIDRQGQMQMQAERLRSRLVAPDEAQALAVGARRKVQVRPILDTQHRLLAAHPLHRARAVRRQNVRRRDLRLRRLVDEPVVALYRRAVVGRIGGEGLSGQRCQQPRALDQTRRQTLVAQRRPSKLVRRPLGAVESVAGPQRRRRCDPRQPQLPAPARLQLVGAFPISRNSV